MLVQGDGCFSSGFEEGSGSVWMIVDGDECVGCDITEHGDGLGMDDRADGRLAG